MKPGLRQVRSGGSWLSVALAFWGCRGSAANPTLCSISVVGAAIACVAVMGCRCRLGNVPNPVHTIARSANQTARSILAAIELFCVNARAAARGHCVADKTRGDRKGAAKPTGALVGPLHAGLNWRCAANTADIAETAAGKRDHLLNQVGGAAQGFLGEMGHSAAWSAHADGRADLARH